MRTRLFYSRRRRQCIVRWAEEKSDTAAMAERLRKLFAKWAEEEAGGLYDDEPSLEEIQRGLDEERECDGYPRRLFSAK